MSEAQSAPGRATGTTEAPETSFRDRALGETPNPLEHIDHLFRHTSRRLWAGVLGLAILVAAGVVWTVVATKAETMQAPALIVPPQGIYAVGVGQTGSVARVRVAEGADVRRGQPLADVVSPTGDRVVVRSPVTGQVIAVDTRTGDSLTGTDPLFRVAPSGAPVGIALVPASRVAQIRVGMSAEMVVNGVSRDSYGEVSGHVSSISPISVSAARLRQITGDDTLVGLTQQLGPLREVQIRLHRADTPSGLAWTRGSGPAAALPVGVRATVTVTVDRRRIISEAFG